MFQLSEIEFLAAYEPILQKFSLLFRENFIITKKSNNSPSSFADYLVEKRRKDLFVSLFTSSADPFELLRLLYPTHGVTHTTPKRLKKHFSGVNPFL